MTAGKVIISWAGKNEACVGDRRFRFRTLVPLSFASALLLEVGMRTGVIAGDYFHFLTSEAYQDAVAIGQVQSRRESELVFRPTRVLLGQRLPRELMIRIPLLEQAKNLQAGDAAVLTLGKAQDHYILNNEAFKVDDANPTQARILSGPLSGDARFMYQRFINSCGGDRSYFYDGKTVFLQKRDRRGNLTGENIPIGRKDGNEWIAVGTNRPVCTPVKLSLWDRLLRFLGDIMSV